MAARMVVAIFALLFIVLLAGMAIAGTVTQLEDGQTSSSLLPEGSSDDLNDELRVTVTNINQGQTNVTLEYQDLRTFETASVTVDVGTAETVVVSGQNVTANVTEIRSDDRVLIHSTYPVTIGWEDGPTLFFQNYGLLLVATIFVTLIGILFIFLLAPPI